MPATLATVPQLDAGSPLLVGSPQEHTRPNRAFAHYLSEVGGAQDASAPNPAAALGVMRDQGPRTPPVTPRAPSKETPDAHAQRERSRERAQEAADIAQRREPIAKADLHHDAGQLAAAELRMHQPSREASSSEGPEVPAERGQQVARHEKPVRATTAATPSREGVASQVVDAGTPAAAQASKPIEATPSVREGAQAPAREGVTPPGAATARAVAAPAGVEPSGAIKGDSRAAAPGAGVPPRTGVSAVSGAGRTMNASAALQKLGGARPSVLVAESAGPMGAQIARGLAGALRQGGGVVTLRLTPEHLGQLKLDLRIEGSSVSATLTPSSEPARQLLEESSGALKAALEARGLTVERIEVAPVRAGEPTDSSPEASDGRGLAGERGSGGAGAESHAGTSGSRDERTEAHAREEHPQPGAWRVRPVVEIERDPQALRIRVDALA